MKNASMRYKAKTPVRLKSLLIAISWLMCRQWGGVIRGITIWQYRAHQRTELTQLGQI